jgi:hypothetical protein
MYLINRYITIFVTFFTLAYAMYLSLVATFAFAIGLGAKVPPMEFYMYIYGVPLFILSIGGVIYFIYARKRVNSFIQNFTMSLLLPSTVLLFYPLLSLLLFLLPDERFDFIAIFFSIGGISAIKLIIDYVIERRGRN